MTPKDAKVIEIQKMAYQLYLQRCREGRPGSAEQDWLQACEMINNKNSSHNSPNNNSEDSKRGRFKP